MKEFDSVSLCLIEKEGTPRVIDYEIEREG